MKISTKTATLMLVIVAAVWGAGFIATQIILDAGFNTYELLTGRFFIGALVLTVIFRNEFKTMNKMDVIAGAITGIVLAIAFILQTLGQDLTTPSIAAFLTAIYVAIVPLLDHLVFKVKIDKYTKVGVVLTIAGIGFITLDSLNFLDSGFLGIALILLCALGYALQILCVDKFTNGKYKISALKISVLMLWFAFIFTFIMSFILGESNPNKDWMHGIVGIIFLGVFSTAIAFSFQNIAQNIVSPTKTSIILSLEAVFGTLWSWLLLGEKFTFNVLVGFAVVFIGLLIIEVKPKFMFFGKKELE